MRIRFAVQTRLYSKIIELYLIFSEWGLWFARLVKLTEHDLLNSPYNLLAIHSLSWIFSYVSNKEIEADEQPLKGYEYLLEVQAA